MTEHIVLYKVDSGGFYVESYVVEVNMNGYPIEDLADSVVSVSPPDGLYRAKWTGSEWVEDMSPEEINELTKPQPIPPTDTERIEMLEETIMFMLLGGV